jgi:hypothetical protein
MMELTLTTPGVFFPALSLLLLAYTNHFLALANLIRTLHATYQQQPAETVLLQIQNLRYRIVLIKNMQATGVASIFLCVVCMALIFFGWPLGARIVFGASLLTLLFSLALSFREIQLSGGALNYLLIDLERRESGRE